MENVVAHGDSNFFVFFEFYHADRASFFLFLHFLWFVCCSRFTLRLISSFLRFVLELTFEREVCLLLFFELAVRALLRLQIDYPLDLPLLFDLSGHLLHLLVDLVLVLLPSFQLHTLHFRPDLFLNLVQKDLLLLLLFLLLLLMPLLGLLSFFFHPLESLAQQVAVRIQVHSRSIGFILSIFEH